MKSIEELSKILVDELMINLLNKDKELLKDVYYNEVMGSTSSLLSVILERILRNEKNDWIHDKWIDDSLLTNINKKRNKITIDGIMIWGHSSKEQFIDLFSFTINLLPKINSFSTLKYFFIDATHNTVNYNRFRQKREFYNELKVKNSAIIIEYKCPI